ncbi:MAG TPA: SDR family NAD(P)-dependent oxidoreductase [Myxococcaceae bacterium]|nr:SDR family NAD(P)-dependent oxidoreductase [Myxococcaceae bacterium]
MNLKGNTILITGGASGIGFHLAKALTELGNKVVITGRDQAKLTKAEQAIPGLKTIRSDAGQAKDIQSLQATVAKDFPELNVLVNNAGIMRTVNLHKPVDSLEDLTREIEINLMGPIRMVATFLPMLKQRQEAAIVNVSSGLAFVPLPTSPIYCATKAAVHSYTRSLRVQLKGTNVKVFDLAPPATETEMLTGSTDAEDLKGVAVMKVQDLVAHAIRGMERNQMEIRPGQANQLRFMNRVAPEFILGQLSKPVERMLRKS